MIKQIGISTILAVIITGLISCSEEDSQTSNGDTNNAQKNQPTAADENKTEEPKAAPVSAAPYDTSNFDIIGISLGMPMEDAATAIENHTTPMNARMGEGDVGSIYGARVRGIKFPLGHILATAMDEKDSLGRITKYANRELISVYGYSIPNDGKVSAIGRSTGFESDVLLSEMREILVSKYGDPVYEGGYLISWSLARDGSPQSNPRILQACSMGFNKNKRGHEVPGVVAYKSDLALGNYTSCGFTFVVELQPSSNPALVSSMTMVLYDMMEINRSNKETIAFTEVEAAKLDAAEKAKAEGAKKPTL